MVTRSNFTRRQVLGGSLVLAAGCVGTAKPSHVDAGADENDDAGVPDAGPVDAGPPPQATWAQGLAVDRWVTLPGTAFLPWANTSIPAGAYRGTDPFGSIINAFCDPANDPVNGAQYFYGGGHGDGTCNAVCKFDHRTLRWSLASQPTPPSVYLPDYLHTTSPLTYPSGKPFAGWFLPADQLADPADAAYRAPALARVSTHMYAASAVRRGVVHFFYLTYGELDTATGQWSGQDVDLGAQLATFRPQYGTVPLQQGTVAVYDEVTDRFYVTLNPGDSGGGWRSGIIVFNPQTRRIENIVESNDTTYGLILNSVSFCRVGRALYVFTKFGNYGDPQVMNQGFVFDMDSKTMRAFVLQGDTAGSTFPSSVTQETIPTWYDGRAIRRWNYASAFATKVLNVELTPTGGTGSTMDPFVLRQTERTIFGTPPTRPMFVFHRFMYSPVADCAVLLPDAASDWLALKLS